MQDEDLVILRNEAIQIVTMTKYLGVIVDQILNWKTTYQRYRTQFRNHVA